MTDFADKSGSGGGTRTPDTRIMISRVSLESRDNFVNDPSDGPQDAETLPAAVNATTPSGYVYFVRAGRTDKVKIGWAREPEKRVEGLQTGCPHQLHLIGFVPGQPADETEWHYRWAEVRGRGEWFSLTNDLRSAINASLMAPEATRYIHIKTDWRAIRRAGMLRQQHPALTNNRMEVRHG